MSAQHTTAPWWPTESGVRDRGGYVAHTHSVQRYEGQDERYALEVAQREADKLLIAAAPDLLDALEETDKDLTVLLSNVSDAEQRDPKWVGMREIVNGWRTRNRAAIAKATGSAS